MRCFPPRAKSFPVPSSLSDDKTQEFLRRLKIALDESESDWHAATVFGLNTDSTANCIPGVNAGNTQWEYKTIAAGTGTSVTHTPNTITIASTGIGTHDLVSVTHTAAGLTTGHFLKATGAGSFGFAAHGLTYSDVGAAANSHSHAGVVPVGGIIMWSGTIATIPANWHLCDGTAGTPDLRNRFVVCADADDSGVAKTTVAGGATQTGGAATHPAHAAHGAQGHSGCAVAAHDWDRAAYDGGGPAYTNTQSHSVTQATAHPSSGFTHDTPSILNPYYSLAFIMRTA